MKQQNSNEREGEDNVTAASFVGNVFGDELQTSDVSDGDDDEQNDGDKESDDDETDDDDYGDICLGSSEQRRAQTINAFRHASLLADRIRRQLRSELGFRCCAGVGRGKMIAKL